MKFILEHAEYWDSYGTHDLIELNENLWFYFYVFWIIELKELGKQKLNHLGKVHECWVEAHHCWVTGHGSFVNV